jgi:hypothetical protein
VAVPAAGAGSPTPDPAPMEPAALGSPFRHLAALALTAPDGAHVTALPAARPNPASTPCSSADVMVASAPAPGAWHVGAANPTPGPWTSSVAVAVGGVPAAAAASGVPKSPQGVHVGFTAGFASPQPVAVKVTVGQSGGGGRRRRRALTQAAGDLVPARPAASPVPDPSPASSTDIQNAGAPASGAWRANGPGWGPGPVTSPWMASMGMLHSPQGMNVSFTRGFASPQPVDVGIPAAVAQPVGVGAGAGQGGGGGRRRRRSLAGAASAAAGAFAVGDRTAGTSSQPYGSTAPPAAAQAAAHVRTAAARRDVARELEGAAGTDGGAAGQAERAAAGQARAAHQAGAAAERGAEASAARRAERAVAAPSRWRHIWRSAMAWPPAAARKPLLRPAGAAGELGASAGAQRALGEAAVTAPYTAVVVAAASEGAPGAQRVGVLVAVPGSRPVDVQVGRRSMQGFARAG